MKGIVLIFMNVSPVELLRLRLQQLGAREQAAVSLRIRMDAAQNDPEEERCRNRDNPEFPA